MFVYDSGHMFRSFVTYLFGQLFDPAAKVPWYATHGNHDTFGKAPCHYPHLLSYLSHRHHQCECPVIDTTYRAVRTPLSQQQPRTPKFSQRDRDRNDSFSPACAPRPCCAATRQSSEVITLNCTGMDGLSLHERRQYTLLSPVRDKLRTYISHPSSQIVQVLQKGFQFVHPLRTVLKRCDPIPNSFITCTHLTKRSIKSASHSFAIKDLHVE